jgi:phenylalanyl-tRNA synthetase beta chain
VKVLRSWLAEMVDLGGRPDAEIAEVLTSAGLAVDAVVRTGGAVDGVVTARVLRVDRHPDAAKVVRVHVDAGDGAERHVWCGASNFGPGDVVPLATLGTTMPDGRTIERRGILGIDSEGMLCSASELGLGEDHSGILVLPPGAPIGVPYGEVLGLRVETLFDLDVTRNRPDCWSHAGVARELAAHAGAELRLPAARLDPTGGDRSAAVDLVAGERCGRFTSTVLSGVRVGPSADWMAHRLTAAGMRPISNVVDVSNYVMLELGAPNHPYDLDTLGGGGFRVRLASPGEAMVTLDGEQRTFEADDLLICDATDRPIGIAGVMGGLDTEITDATTTVALEIAWFEPLGILRTTSRLGLRSDASARFERGVDPYGADLAVARFVQLLRETCPDLVVHRGAVDARGPALPPERRTTSVRVAQVNRILGTALAASDLPPLLDPIGYTVLTAAPDLSARDPAGGDLGQTERVETVVLPSWRLDSTEEVDVVEEVARRYGYDRIGKVLPTSTVHGRLSATQQRRRLVREVLLGLGVSEAMPNPFLAPDTLERAGLAGDALTITNPLVAEESVLRTSLRPGLLQAIAYNESHRQLGVRLFEIGHVYPPAVGELPGEYEALCVVLAGQEAPAAMAVWRELAAALGVGARVDQSVVPSGLHATRSATLTAGRDAIGAVGEVDPGVLETFGIAERVAVLELRLDDLLAREPKPATWRPIPRFPSSDLDLAFVLDESVPAERLDKALRQAAGNLLVDLELFDVYRGPAMGDGRRSLAYRLRLQAPDRSLTDADIASVRERCAAAAAKLGATLRA